VCVVYRGAEGKWITEVRQYDTKRKSLQAMARWFQQMRGTDAAIESTANYWRPVFFPGIYLTKYGCNNVTRHTVSNSS